MKKITRFCISVLVGAYCFVPVLSAGSIGFSSLAGQTVSLSVESYASGENDGAYYVGLTQGFINGDSSDAFFMYCVDFIGEINPPTTYTVTVLSVSSATGNQEGLSVAQLETEYILGQQFGSSPSGNSANDSDIQHDIWNYTGGTFSADLGMTSLMTSAANTLSTASASYFNNAYLLDVTAPTGQQAFMVELAPPAASNSNASTLPEPAGMLLTGSGLLALLFGYGRRSRQPGL